MLDLSVPVFGDNQQHLRGEISPSLLELQHLNHLDLSGNDFEGKRMRPKFNGYLSRLKYLNVSFAYLGGPLPSELGNLSKLHSLHLHFNSDLTSQNLDWLSGLSSLRYLDLCEVNLSHGLATSH